MEGALASLPGLERILGWIEVGLLAATFEAEY